MPSTVCKSVPVAIGSAPALMGIGVVPASASGAANAKRPAAPLADAKRPTAKKTLTELAAPFVSFLSPNFVIVLTPEQRCEELLRLYENKAFMKLIEKKRLDVSGDFFFQQQKLKQL